MVTTAILLPKDFISPFEYQVAPRALRRAFCSHLAMRGAPARAIQELAGHRDLATTMPDIRLHDLRHSCARLLLAQEVNPRVVHEVLGHSAITLTLGTYSHVLPALGRRLPRSSMRR